MRTKRRLFTAVIAIVALGVLVSGTAAAPTNGNAKRTLQIVATETQSEFLDLGSAGPSLGDQFVISEELSRGGQEIGESGIVCTATHVLPPFDVVTFQCVASLSLKDGQITLQGLIEVQGEDDTGPFTVAITGGTGAYRGASGEAVIQGIDDGSIYTLQLSGRTGRP